VALVFCAKFVATEPLESTMEFQAATAAEDFLSEALEGELSGEKRVITGS
jgi:hypothetical protein